MRYEQVGLLFMQNMDGPPLCLNVSASLSAQLWHTGWTKTSKKAGLDSNRGVIHNIPMAVTDNDCSFESRELAQMDALLPGLMVLTLSTCDFKRGLVKRTGISRFS